MKYDVTIIGGGPAGISAALILAKHGLKILIIEENASLGGKLPLQLHKENGDKWWKGKEIAQKMLQSLQSYPNVHTLLNTQVWNIEPGFNIFVSSVTHEKVFPIIETNKILLATGAIENGIPLNGWTKPGVLTVGGAQVLLNQYMVKPGNRVAIVGLDILSLAIAQNMKLAGIDVVGIYLPEKNPFTESFAVPDTVMKNLSTLKNSAPNWFLKSALQVLKTSFGRKIAHAMQFKNGIQIMGIPVYLNKCITGITGQEEVEGITIQSVDQMGNPYGETAVEKVDVVCLSGGLVPQTELAVILKCEFAAVEELNAKIPIHNNYYESTVENVYLAGNITGIESAKICMKQGEIAALSMLRKMELLQDETVLIEHTKQLEELRQKAAVQFNPNIQTGKSKIHDVWNHVMEI